MSPQTPRVVTLACDNPQNIKRFDGEFDSSINKPFYAPWQAQRLSNQYRCSLSHAKLICNLQSYGGAHG